MFALDPLKLQQPGAEFDHMSADLCNWDFLQDLEFAPDLEIDNTAISQVLAPPSSHELQKERNRKAQQRARQKKKVRKVCHCQLCKLGLERYIQRPTPSVSQERSQNIECQLAETASQLQALKLRQRQIEARNHLLELAAANKLPVSVPQQNLQVGQPNQSGAGMIVRPVSIHSADCATTAVSSLLYFHRLRREELY